MYTEFFPQLLLGELAFIISCFLFQRALPKMKPGLYKTDGNTNIIVWHLNNALANALENSGLKTPIYSFHLTKWLDLMS